MLTQILINGLISGLLLCLMALGFHIVFASTKIFHIAQGGAYVAGAYFFYWFSNVTGNVLIAIIGALLFSFVAGVLMHLFVYKPLLSKSLNQNIALISSLGVYIIIVNLIALFFGNETKIFSNTIYDSIQLCGIIITRPQLWQILTAIPLIVLFIVFINATGLGLKIKAISDNPLLARVVGININKVHILVFGIASILAAVAALLKAFDTGIDPYSGMSITLSAAVVVIIGGSGSLKGTVIASFVLAVLQNFTEFFLSAQWKDTVTFAILIVVLLWRTEGILQFNIRADDK